MRVVSTICFFAFLIACVSAACETKTILSTQGWSGQNNGITGVTAATVQVTPNEETVVYLADAAVKGSAELFSVPAAGGFPVKLNRGLVTGGTVSDFRVISNDQVLYIANADDATNDEFYVTSTTAATSKPLSPAIPSGNTNRKTRPGFQLAGTNVVFLGNFGANDTRTETALYSAPISGTSRGIRISQLADTPGTQNVRDFIVGSSRVVYSGNLGEVGDFDLYSTSITSENVKALSPTKAGRSVDPIPSYRFNQAMNSVYFVGNLNNSTDVTGKELYIVPADGSSAAGLLSPANPGTRAFSRYEVAGSRVVFQCSFGTSAADSLLYSTGSTAADVKVVSVEKAAGGSVQQDWVVVGDRVYFRAALEADNTNNALYQASASVNATANNRISQETNIGGVDDFKVASNAVAFRGSLIKDKGQQLFSTPPTTSSIKVLSPDAADPTTQTVEADYNVQNNVHAIFRGALNSDASITNIELYSNVLTGAASNAIRLASPADPEDKSGYDVKAGFQWSPNQNHIVFPASLTFTDSTELYSASPNGPADKAVKLNDDLDGGVSVGQFAITEDSSLVVFISQPAGLRSLYTAPIAGSASPNAIISQASVAPAGNVESFAFFSGSSKALYNGKLNNQNVADLYDTCTGAVRVTQPPTVPVTTTRVNATSTTRPVNGTTSITTTTDASVTTTSDASFVSFPAVIVVALVVISAVFM